jgi:O-methyltransferase involved in polyketide biosynthesis
MEQVEMNLANKESTTMITGVSETLMITLYARYLETNRDDSIIKDSKAVEIVESLDYDFTKFTTGWASQLGCVIRAKNFDRVISDFIKTHPNAVIINLGSGLCTRFFRVDNGTIIWYEVDFPEVIQLRHKLISETERYQFISKSILDFTWIDEIKREPNQPVLIIAEGVCMYLTEAQNKLLFQEISKRFQDVEMMIDAISPGMAKNSKRHDTVSKTDAEFQWGIKQVTELETWDSGIKILEVNHYLTNFAKYPHRLKWWMKYLVFILVPLYKNQSRIVRLHLNANGSTSRKDSLTASSPNKL